MRLKALTSCAKFYSIDFSPDHIRPRSASLPGSSWRLEAPDDLWNRSRPVTFWLGQIQLINFMENKLSFMLVENRVYCVKAIQIIVHPNNKWHTLEVKSHV